MGKGGYQILDFKGSRIGISFVGNEHIIETNITNNDVINAVKSNKPIMITNLSVNAKTGYEEGVISTSQNFWAMSTRPFKASFNDVAIYYRLQFFVFIYGTMCVINIESNINALGHKPTITINKIAPTAE